MKKRANRPLIAILSILIIPVIVYGVFELSSLTVDERELEKIYERQLESVLFSINQSVQDKVSDITTMMDRDLGVVSDQEWMDELSAYNFFWALYLKDVSDSQKQLYALESHRDDGLLEVADSIYAANSDVFNRLLRYKEAGDFMKIENSKRQLFNKGVELDYFYFVLGSGESAKFGIYFFDAVLMIEQYLVPKFQEIARDDFVLSCSRISDGYLVYSTSNSTIGVR